MLAQRLAGGKQFVFANRKIDIIHIAILSCFHNKNIACLQNVSNLVSNVR